MQPLHSTAGSSFRQRLSDFFYREETPYGMALVRIVFPLALLLPSLPRWAMTREYYSTDGAACPLWINYGFPDLLPVPSAAVAVILNTLLIFTLVTSSIGWMTRVSLAVSGTLFVYINLLDSISTMTKYSCVAAHAMLLLAVSQSGAIWSVDSWLARRRESEPPRLPGTPRARPKFPVWPCRLIQLMIALVYFGAAVTKLHTPEFATGEQLLYWMITEVNHPHPIGVQMSQHPVLVIVGAYATMVWEITFLFVAWRGRLRLSMLAIGVLFHLSTSFLLGLYVFPIICVSIYFAWVDERDVQWISQSARRLGRKFGWHRRRLAERAVASPLAPLPNRRFASAAAFACAVAVVSSGGLWLERQLDVYGKRRPEGPYELTAMDPAEAARLLGPSKRIRDRDKIDGFALGTTTIAGYLANQREDFHHGERMIAEISFTPPHEDLWIEVNIHDADGHLVERGHSVIMREKFRGFFEYPITNAYRPGAYQAVLLNAGKEVARRTFTVHGSSPRANAN